MVRSRTTTEKKGDRKKRRTDRDEKLVGRVHEWGVERRCRQTSEKRGDQNDQKPDADRRRSRRETERILSKSEKEEEKDANHEKSASESESREEKGGWKRGEVTK